MEFLSWIKKNDLNTPVALGCVKGLHNFKKSYVLIVFLLCLPHPDICEQVPQRGISVLLQELVRRVQCMVTQSSADVTQVLWAESIPFIGQAEAKFWVQNVAQLHHLPQQGFLPLLTQLPLLVRGAVSTSPHEARLGWASSVMRGVQCLVKWQHTKPPPSLELRGNFTAE